MMNAENTALLMIDIQNDFCPGGALAVADGDAVVAVTNTLLKHFPVQVLTQDWHPANHSSFAANHSGAEAFSLIPMPYGDQVLWPSHCVQGSDGAEFHPDLICESADVVIRKGYNLAIDSYSAFFENDRKTKTGLAGYLRDRDIKSVVLTGLATDFCVYFTAIDAADLGFDVTLVSDACRAIDLDGSLDAAMTAMTGRGIAFTTSADII
jgi:nicotinamidase/pyrazinamidase